MKGASPGAMPSEWVASYPAEIMVCDADGTILEMNDVAIRMYEAEGGAAMVGSNVFAHHKEPARSQVAQAIHQRRHLIYTTEKAGIRKLVSIAPWYRAGRYAGFALFVLNLPPEVPNLVKD
jgi:PAS domain-containing protein